VRSVIIDKKPGYQSWASGLVRRFVTGKNADGAERFHVRKIKILIDRAKV
jgi:hypothetical protein